MVGTQADLRDDPIAIEKLQRNKQKPIGTEQAERLARDLKVSVSDKINSVSISQWRKPMEEIRAHQKMMPR